MTDRLRLALFIDANNAGSAAIVRGLLGVVDRRRDVELCGIVTSRPDAFRWRPARAIRRATRRLVVAAVAPRSVRLVTRPHTVNLYRVARALGIPVLVPPAAGVNDPAFVERLVSTLRPDVGFACYCVRIWKPALLDAFEQTVNYHDGLLPAYRGVAATAFSIYRGEARSGLTFHRMTRGIDEGPVLAEGSVAVGARTYAEVDRAKTDAGAAMLPDVVDALVRRDPGRPQTGPANYFSARDLRAVISVPDPETVTADELALRIRAFGAVRLTVDGAVWPVTRIRPGRHGRLSFRTGDGEWWTADRVRELPVRLQRPVVQRGGR